MKLEGNAMKSCYKVLIIISGFVPLLMLSTLFLENINNVYDGGDKWHFLDLSQNIFSNFYYYGGVQQFFFATDYSMALPPLYPTIIAIFNLIFDIGIYAEYFLNIIASALTFLVLIKISQLLFKDKFIGVFIYFLILVQKVYWENIAIWIDTHSIFVLIVFFTMYLILKKGTDNYRNVALIGILCGLATMQRFDFILASMVLGIVIFSENFRLNVKKTTIYYIFYFIAISPWIIHSYIRFGKFFASDNSGNLFSLEFIYPIGVYIEKPQTIMDDPFLWLYGTLSKIYNGTIRLNSIISDETVPFLIIILLFSIYALLFDKVQITKLETRSYRFLIVLLKYSLVFGAQFLTILLSGFHASRYMITIRIFLIIFFIFIIFNLFHNSLRQRIKPFLACIIIIAGGIFIYRHGNNITKIGFNTVNFELNQREQSVVECLYENMDISKEEVLWYGKAYKLGALTDLRIVLMPWAGSSTPENISWVIEKFGVEYFYAEDDLKYSYVFGDIKRTQLCELPVYRVES